LSRVIRALSPILTLASTTTTRYLHSFPTRRSSDLATIVELGIGGFCAMKALSTRNDDPQHASRPFDLERDGFVMGEGAGVITNPDRKSTRLNSSHQIISYAVFCLKKKRKDDQNNEL